MKDVIERILKEEEAARKRVDEAETRAEDIIAGAKKEASAFTEEMTEKAADYAGRKKDEYEHQFLVEKEKLLQQAGEEAAASRKDKEKSMDSISKSVFLRITTIPE